MQLTPNLVRAYVDLVEAATGSETTLRLVEQLSVGRDEWRDIFVVPDAGGISESMRLDPLGHNRWRVVARRRPGVDDRRRVALRSLVAEVTQALRRRDAHEAIVHLSQDIESGFDAALRREGWTQAHDRVEFTAPLHALPHAVGSPFHWRTVTGDETTDDQLEFLGRVAVGDPESDWSETSFRDLLASHTRLSIGSVRGEDVAAVVTRISDSSVATILYLGLIVDNRGQRLARWLFRHAFDYFRGHGGTVYLASVHADNGPILHLLRTMGCEETTRLSEWVWSAQ